MLTEISSLSVISASVLAVGDAWLTAVTIALAGEGNTDGAVYSPLAVIVPDEGFPPATPFTCQLTFVLLVPETVA
jgi:hypothetical protein